MERESFQSERVTNAPGSVTDEGAGIPGPGFDLEVSTAGIRGGNEEAGDTVTPDAIDRWTECLPLNKRKARRVLRNRSGFALEIDV
mmetsp:Transcript_22153/g.89706  ORF Transcript_22153/g.89706 Transcript_22153/m.89706 type:complete len:86 (+) Transcript_22153:1324-1581(+)